MTKDEVLNLLQSHENEAGIVNWNNLEFNNCQLQSFGIGLTMLRKLAKQIGKSHELAIELWDSKNYDVKVVSVLIDDAKHITQEQMETQVGNIDYGHMVHVYSACGAPVTKTKFIDQLASQWIESKDSVRRRCAYGFIYELSKSKKKSAPNNGYFLKYINHINSSFSQEHKSVHMSMGAALMGMGKRNLELNQAALKVANEIGQIPVESGKTQCDPFDVSKHLTSDYLMKKLGLK